jgi:hypothetical protein
MHPSIQKNHMQAIRKNPGSPLQKQLLRTCSLLAIPSPAILKEYHDALLFVMAFPPDESTREIALAELKRCSAITEKKKSFYWQHALAGSGLPGTELRCQYSRDLLRWLLETCPDQIQPAESAAGVEDIKSVFQVLLPGIEFNEASSGEENVWKRIRDLSGHYFNREALLWLLGLVEQQTLPELLKDQLFDRLQIYSSWHLSAGGLNRSFIQWPVKQIQIYKTGKKSVPGDLLRKKINNEDNLRPAERVRLIATARASLAFYYRETDPFTYADPASASLFEMGDGFQVALFGMRKERQLSLDSYIGFLAFKNGIPVAYGGGWIFGYRCKIGVNIYPPFRGADSALLFTQVMRAYYQQFRVHYFLVKPYQFGKGNPEGLKSGAYWFYYKLGFRSTDSGLAQLANEEWDRIRGTAGYRTALPVLKKLTGSPLVLVLNKKGADAPRAAVLSGRISQLIRDRFDGNRQLALEEAKRIWLSFIGPDLKGIPGQTSGRLDNWVLLFLVFSGENSSKKEWKKLARLYFTGRETDFIRAWQDSFSARKGKTAPLKSK